MYYLQKTVFIEAGHVTKLQHELDKVIKEGSRIDFIVPNHHGGGWLIVYTPNK